MIFDNEIECFDHIYSLFLGTNKIKKTPKTSTFPEKLLVFKTFDFTIEVCQFWVEIEAVCQ